MKAVYTELHRSHDPQFFLVRGVVQRTTEQPERADRLLAGLKAGKHDLVAPTMFGQGPRARVHSPEYLRFLEEAWDAWTALGDSGPEMIANMHPVRYAATYPTHIVGRLGWHTIDTSCPIGPGTWAAACAATDVAATAAQLVMDGEDATYALCRPPGHHAYRDLASGFCFLNNSAVAAAQLAEARARRDPRCRCAPRQRHAGHLLRTARRAHGVDPCRSVFFNPFVWGYAHERGAGPGLGANLNIPLPKGTGDDDYIKAIGEAENHPRVCARRARGGARSRCLGARSARRPCGDDGRLPAHWCCDRAIGPSDRFRAGGGYLSDILGANLTAALGGFEEAR